MTNRKMQRGADDGFSSSKQELERVRLELGGRIREIRKQRLGWSPETMARKLGISRSTILRYESGDRTPDLIVLMRLAKLADVSVCWLIDGDEVPEVGDGSAGSGISHELYEMLVKSMTKHGILKEEWAIPISYFVRAYNDVVRTSGSPDEIEHAVLRFLANHYRQRLADIDDERYRDGLAMLRERYAADLQSIERDLNTG